MTRLSHRFFNFASLVSLCDCAEAFASLFLSDTAKTMQ